MSIDGLLLLPADVQIVPAAELPAGVRARIGACDGDFTITRPCSRANSGVLDVDGVELLANFRRPARIVDAVLAFAGQRHRDPATMLDQAYPLLSRLYRMQLLVPAGSDRAGCIDGELREGDEFAGLRLVRRVQILEDNEVFLARDRQGRHVAVKYCRRADSQAARRLEREAAVLARLRAVRAPRLLGRRRAGTGVGLVTEWICGVDALGAAQALHGPDPPRRERALLSLCVEMTAAFGQLHAAGLLHGDVHPRNILVEQSGQVRLIDFGLARDIRSPGADDERAGAAFYSEPEYAQAQRLGQSIAPAMAGEQYSIAVLLYQLWTGLHYLDWSLERDEMLRQIVEDDPVPFARRCVPAWPELERILRRALDKDPRRRFPDVPSLGDALRGLLEAARERDRRFGSGRPAAAADRDRVEPTLARFALGGNALRDGLAAAPSASIHFGAAGIAYALLRIAQRRGDPGLLAAADVWSQKACAMAADDRAFYDAGLAIERRSVGAISLFHSEAGLHCVRALVSAAQGDANSTNRALQAFVAHSRRPCGCDHPWGELDLSVGRAGLLLGCAELLESMPDQPAFDLAGVRARGGQIAAELLTAIRLGPIGSSDLDTLGLVHGWAGLMLALLRWALALQRDPDAALAQRLQELAALAEPHGTGLCWPVRRAHCAFQHGWCNGSAGHAMLFSLAHQAFGLDRFAQVAERAALGAASSDAPDGSLCCGQAGIGYAMLSLHRLTGSVAWLQRARTAARRAATDRSGSLRADALYAGAVGAALLVEDLQDPAGAAMPLVEPRR